MYQYNATLVRVIDGDTVVLDVDLGFHTTRRETFRLHGINAPEMHTSEGKAAKAAAEQWLLTQGPVYIETFKDAQEKYGRFLARVILRDNSGRSLNQWMIDAKHAVPYMTR